MILILYNLSLILALVISAPWWLLQMASTRKYREGLMERLGYVRRLTAVAGLPVIWVHAVSVGEVLAVSGLVSRLDEELPGYRVVVSTTTRTGQVLARTHFGADRVFYCPLDLPWAVRAHLKQLQPTMLVLAETEFWPNLLHACNRRSIPVVVVNARISDRSWPRYRRLRRLWQPFLSKLSCVLAQTETDAERLHVIGIEQVMVGGNLKFDARVQADSEATGILRRLGGSLRFVVVGSTLEGEEAALIEEWARLLAADPHLVLLLAPRHPERFASVAALLEATHYRWRRRSTMGPGSASPLAPGEIILLDTIGELASVYGLASVAFVGGSLVPAGGHNPLEPAQFGVPVVMGDHYENFQLIVDHLRDADALSIVEPAELGDVLINLLTDRANAVAMGERGRAAFARRGGATARAVTAITEVLRREAV